MAPRGSRPARGPRPDPTPAEARASRLWDKARARARAMTREVSPAAGDAVWQDVGTAIERALLASEARLNGTR